MVDHGSLILLAYNYNPTNMLLYRYDEGLTWQELPQYELKNMNISNKFEEAKEEQKENHIREML